MFLTYKECVLVVSKISFVFIDVVVINLVGFAWESELSFIFTHRH